MKRFIWSVFSMWAFLSLTIIGTQIVRLPQPCGANLVLEARAPASFGGEHTRQLVDLRTHITVSQTASATTQTPRAIGIDDQATLSPDGQFAAQVTRDADRTHTLEIISTTTGAQHYQQRTATPPTAYWLADALLLWRENDFDNDLTHIRMIDMHTTTTHYQHQFDRTSAALTFSQDGTTMILRHRMATTDRPIFGLSLINIADGSIHQFRQNITNYRPTSTDENWFFAEYSSPIFYLLDARTGTPHPQLPQGIQGVNPTLRGDFIWYSPGGNANRVRRFSLVDGSDDMLFSGGVLNTVSPDGAWLHVNVFSEFVSSFVVHLPTNTRYHLNARIPHGRRNVYRVLFSADSRCMAVLAVDDAFMVPNNLTIFELDSFEVVYQTSLTWTKSYEIFWRNGNPHNRIFAPHAPLGA